MSAGAAKINQKEYLKKYLSGDKKKKKKKRDKNKESQVKVRIIDDDDIGALNEEIDEELLLGGEDAPQIVGEYIETSANGASKWRNIAVKEEPEDEAGAVKQERPEAELWGRKAERIKIKDEFMPKSIGRRQGTPYYSPQRKKHTSDGKRNGSKEHRRAADLGKSGEGARNKSRWRSPTPKSRSPTNADLSPPRISSKQTSPRARHKADQSPPRRPRKSPSSDQSPPRRVRAHRRDSTQSPPRRQKTADDQSPPRKSRRDAERSPKSSVPCRSPTRRRKNSTSAEQPPPRKSRWAAESSPPRQSAQSAAVAGDQSPPRKRQQQQRSPQRSPLRRRRDSDQSPPRRRKGTPSPPASRRFNSPTARARRDSDQSPPRRRRNSPAQQAIKREHAFASPVRIKREKLSPTQAHGSKFPRDASFAPKGHFKNARSDSPPPTHKPKAATTLDGKRAGLQDAKSLQVETDERRRQEERMYGQLPTDISGRDAEVQVRSTGRRGRRAREAEAEDPEEMRRKDEREQKKLQQYERWGKGLKQLEDHQARMAAQEYESSKPLARYSDDKDLDKHLRERERADDPMLEYMRKKRKERDQADNVPVKPIYEGAYPENRFGIRPGYRWDGVDRSNGYEKKWFAKQNEKVANQEEAYKYSVEDM